MRLVTESKAPSLNEIRQRIARFVVEYKDAASERSDAQNFWRDLMACYGVDSVRRKGVIFEHQARRADTGNYGSIDVFKPGLFLIEHKSAGKLVTPKGASVSNAEAQANAYLAGGSISGALPRYVLTSDFSSIQVTDLLRRKDDPTRTLTIRTLDLPDYVESFLFLTAESDVEAIIREDQADASVKASRIMGDLFTALTKDGDLQDGEVEEDEETHDASILLTRLLFLMFGDDAGLWSRAAFHRFVVDRTAEDGSDMAGQLTMLFEVLDTPEHKRDKRTDEAFARFPYVNGAVFERGAIKKMPWFDKKMRDALVTACEFDWSRISPAVFGSLFQTVHSKEARHAGGEHYTSEENILKTLRPLFLDDLRRRMDAANTKPQLESLHAELARLRFVDPACGCGNFLIVAYREMRQLELDLLMKLRSKQGTTQMLLDPSRMLKVTLDQFTGIEIKWWPAKIAETAMFLVDHQANATMAKTLGVAPNRLPINVAANIVHANALATSWRAILPETGPTIFVFGNPPFVGTKERSKQQTAELKAVWGARYDGFLDYVTAWHMRALQYLDDKEGQFAFVSTNSICQGVQPATLSPAIRDAGWRISFAHRTFEWDSESASKDKAAVHCVIVGFSRDDEIAPRLFDYPDRKREPVEIKPAIGVNAYLVDGPDVLVTTRTKPMARDVPEVRAGSKAVDWGFLTIEDQDEHDRLIADPVVSKFVRPFLGGKELINGIGRWCLWLEDVTQADIKASSELRERIRKVKELREASDKTATRRAADTPHLFGERYQPMVPYLGIPQTFSENRLYATAARLDERTIASMKLFTCADPDGFAFALISSSMFITWQKTVGGRLKSDPSFSNTLVWNNLPLPPLDRAVRQDIIEAGKGVLGARARNPDWTLAQHYEPLSMRPELLSAHRELDRLVDRAFGAGRGHMTEFKRQSVLFDRYAEMADVAQ